MLQGDTVKTYLTKLALGVFVFVLVVAGGAWYLQSSLLLVKHYDPYTHWSVLLFALPLLAGFGKRFLGTPTPMLSTLIAALLSALILYPQYKKLWAVPPEMMDVAIYVMIVFGIGYIATQPLKTTFMIAFRLGKYSLAGLTARKAAGKNVSSTVTPKGKMSKTQQLQNRPHGNLIAMMELMIGVCSLALSVFSVFFLGRA